MNNQQVMDLWLSFLLLYDRFIENYVKKSYHGAGPVGLFVNL